MKHAYLILAHDDVPMLSRLVSCLDDSRNDIFIHWDAKSGDFPKLKLEHAGLFFTERVDVRWGSFSMVQAEYILMETALSYGSYSYYHLLSGADLPIKSQDFIHSFLLEKAGIEFIAFAGASDKEIRYRTSHSFLFSEDFRSRSIIKRGLRLAWLKVQDILHVARNTGIEFKKGSQWFTVTEDFVRYAVAKKEDVSRMFKRSFCPDEMFIQTLCYNSNFYSRIYDSSSEFNGNLRFIKWERGRLIDICASDFDTMKDSNRLFARKFSSEEWQLADNVVNFVSCN